MNSVCGRMKSDYRYSNNLVYNNFPWPEKVNEKQKKSIEKLAKEVLKVRGEFHSGLADLYNITTMPKKWIQMSTLTFLISAGAVFENGIGAPTAGLISRFKTVLGPTSGTLNVI